MHSQASGSADGGARSVAPGTQEQESPSGDITCRELRKGVGLSFATVGCRLKCLSQRLDGAGLWHTETETPNSHAGGNLDGQGRSHCGYGQDAVRQRDADAQVQRRAWQPSDGEAGKRSRAPVKFLSAAAENGGRGGHGDQHVGEAAAHGLAEPWAGLGSSGAVMRRTQGGGVSVVLRRRAVIEAQHERGEVAAAVQDASRVVRLQSDGGHLSELGS